MIRATPPETLPGPATPSTSSRNRLDHVAVAGPQKSRVLGVTKLGYVVVHELWTTACVCHKNIFSNSTIHNVLLVLPFGFHTRGFETAAECFTPLLFLRVFVPY